MSQTILHRKPSPKYRSHTCLLTVQQIQEQTQFIDASSCIGPSASLILATVALAIDAPI